MYRKNKIHNFGQNAAREETTRQNYIYLGETWHESLDLIQLVQDRTINWLL